MIESIITIGFVASLFLEGIKLLARKFVFNNPLYEFPMEFYYIMLPVSQVLITPIMLWLGLEGLGVSFASFGDFVRLIIVTALQSAASIITHEQVLSPLKNAGWIREFREVTEDIDEVTV